MKKSSPSAHLLGICLVALACYALLNGQAVALLLQETELPRFFATAVQGMGRVTGGAFLFGRMTAALDSLTDYDVVVGQNMAAPLASPSMSEHMEVKSERTPEPKPEQAPELEPSRAPQPAQQPVPQASPAPAASPASPVAPLATAPAEPVASAVTPATSSEAGQKAVSAAAEKPVVQARTGEKSIFDTRLSRRYTVMFAGDSFMEDMILAVQRTWYNKDPNVQFMSVAKHSTGLCVSTKWNWPKKLEGFVQKHKPDVVLIFMGANDLQSIFDGERKYAFTSPAWKQRYVEIAESMIDAVRKGGAVPIWIGLPIMGIEPYSKWVPLVSQLQREASRNKGVDYIETTPILGDAQGQYQVFKTTPEGEQVRLRKADKYHVAFAGCVMILEEAVPRIRAHILQKEQQHALSTTGAP